MEILRKVQSKDKGLDMEKIKNITRIFDCKQDSVALFDLDGTLLDGDLGETSYYVMMLLAAKGEKPELGNIRKCAEELGKKEINEILRGRREWGYFKKYISLIKRKKYIDAYLMTARYIEAFAYEDVVELCRNTLNVFADRPIIKKIEDTDLVFHSGNNDSMLSCIRYMLNEGVQTYIVSASPECVLRAFCEINSLNGVECIGSRSCDGKDIPYSLGKTRQLMKRNISQPSIAFGNSEGDKDMLCSAETAVLRGCDDADMLELAKKNNWIIID